VDLDDALDELIERLTGVGLPRPDAPADPQALQALETELAPLRVPGEVRRFWERVDAHTLRLNSGTPLHGPDFALTTWRWTRDEFRALQPMALLQIGYDSHQCMSAELEFGDDPGGALYEFNVVDGDFTRRFSSLADWLRYLSLLIESGNLLRYQTPNGPSVHVPALGRWEEEQARRPVQAVIGRDILDWPERWQRLNGLEAADLRLRGATSTIAALLATRPDEPAHATIAGLVVALAGSTAGVRVRVEDESARIDVLCPPGTTLLGPRLGQRFEFDVVVPAGPRVRPPAGSTGAASVASVLHARHGGPTGATAEAVRPAPH
jgi:hypothetical protein